MASDAFNDGEHDNIIDSAEALVRKKKWRYSKTENGTLNTIIKGEWTTYTLVMHQESYSNGDTCLRYNIYYDLDGVNGSNYLEFLKAINKANRDINGTSLTYWDEHAIMMLKGENIFSEEMLPSQEWIDGLIMKLINTQEQHYAVFQMIKDGSSMEKSMKEAHKVAMYTGKIIPQ